jgi:hypothetical protein
MPYCMDNRKNDNTIRECRRFETRLGRPPRAFTQSEAEGRESCESMIPNLLCKKHVCKRGRRRESYETARRSWPAAAVKKPQDIVSVSKPCQMLLVYCDFASRLLNHAWG